MHEPLKQRTYHADNFVQTSVVGIMAHLSNTKMSRYRSDKVTANKNTESKSSEAFKSYDLQQASTVTGVNLQVVGRT
jgi:hypothetical protein